MRKIICLLFLNICLTVSAQKATDSAISHTLDSVTITALGKNLLRNIPYNIQSVNIALLQQTTPRVQLMNHLQQLPSVSVINSGNGINKPVIRGLSFNHIQLFAQGSRIDNQTWDDRHDIGISDNGFDKVEIVNGPAALLLGPNTMGGAIVFSETPFSNMEKSKGFVQLATFTNSVGGNINAGIRGKKNSIYYSLHGGYQMHANYMQGGGKAENADEEPLAFNSKFTNIALKGTLGTQTSTSRHLLSYNVYKQALGIIEDESLEAANNPDKKEERDYEMEAPYQDVITHAIAIENSFKTGANSELAVNAGYQFNDRKEFEPDRIAPKSKFLGVGLALQTLTADVQWMTGKSKKAGVDIGLQAFYQTNKNKGEQVLVPNAHITTGGAFAVGHYNNGPWNLLAGVRVDAHQIKSFTTVERRPDTLQPLLLTQPAQQLKRNYTPLSFSGGAVYHVNNSLSVKANIASGYSAPNYAQLTAFGRHEGTYRFEIGDNNLDMEQNIEGDLTLQWETKNVSASLNGYINHIRNYVFIAPTADSAGPLAVYGWMQRDADIKGVEMNVQLHPANSWFEGYIRGGIVRGSLSGNMGNLPYIPADKLITGITWKANKISQRGWQQPYITLQLGIYNSQNKVAAFEQVTKGYAVTDVYAGITPAIGNGNRWKLVLFCDNIFDVGYFNHLSLVKTIGVKEPGRNIGLQIRYSF